MSRKCVRKCEGRGIAAAEGGEVGEIIRLNVRSPLFTMGRGNFNFGNCGPDSRG